MGTNLFLLLIMIQLHIIDDFLLQNKLSSFKQKKWWQENYPDELYKKDYIIALLIHSFSWCFCVMLVPFIIGWQLGTLSWLHYVMFTVNTAVHTIVDDLKANKLKLNLTQDQLIHLIQIIITWLVLIVYKI